ncbi:MAG: DUF308 domain-containing protein [Solirubrobacterales bacterium]
MAKAEHPLEEAASKWWLVLLVGLITVAAGVLALAYMLLGLISIAAGVIILGDPDIGLRTLAILAGIMFIVRGTLEIVAGVALRRLRPT